METHGTNLSKYFERKNESSAFHVRLSEVGGTIVFSNSGKRGGVKEFTLGLESFIEILEDINENVSEFKQYQDYNEKEWRDLGSKYFKDGSANSMSTVQTKPLFSTISKIIAWANYPTYEDVDLDQNIVINHESIEVAIHKIRELSNRFRARKSEVDISQYIKLFNQTNYKLLQSDYREIWKKSLTSKGEWESEIDSKIHLIKNPKDRAAVQSVIEDLRNDSQRFGEKDIPKLAVYSRVIDQALNVSNFLNNFTPKRLEKNGYQLHELVNKIKESKTFSEFSDGIELRGTLEKMAPYYYSAVKHCQDPFNYPVYYKFWYTIMDKVLGKGSDYDTLCEFYRTFPKPQRTRHFYVFFETLCKAFLWKIKSDYGNELDQITHRKLSKIFTIERFVKEAFEKDQSAVKQEPFEIGMFEKSCELAGLFYDDSICRRFVASLLSKPFVILTGLSGSGKTKLAHAFAQWICEEKQQYCLVPVGADWTNREPLLGYPNALNPGEYVKPDSKVLDLLIRAETDQERPYFLILDEMNLSHVERYFADFLSVMESGDSIPLYAGDEVIDDIPSDLRLPPNVFIIGTVNIDETTNMFSPKVLDRANTIEFRISESDLEGFLNNHKEIDMGALQSKGEGMAHSFVEMAKDSATATGDIEEIKTTLIRFFEQLKKAGAEFGYRTASEIVRLIQNLTRLDDEMRLDEKLDIAIMQKLLPKLHGSRRKLVGVLTTLAEFCVTEKIENVEKEVFNAEEFKFTDSENVKFPLSLEKIARMHKAAIDNGFTSFAEA